MPKSRIILVLGALIALQPLLGFPRSWELVFQVLAGLSIVILSIWSTIDKKLTLKAKAQQRQSRRSVDTDAEPNPQSGPNPTAPNYGRRVTDFYPKTGQPGRRVSDIQPTLEPNPDEQQFGN